MCTDSEDNVIYYAACHSPNPHVIVKVNKHGIQQWYKELSDFCTIGPIYMVVDSNDDIILGHGFGKGVGNPLVSKLDGTDGSVLWTKEFDDDLTSWCYGVAVDSYDNVYAVGKFLSTNWYQIYAWEPDGTYKARKSFVNSASVVVGAIAISGYDVFVGGIWWDPYPDYFRAARLNTSLGLIWQRGCESNDAAFYFIAIDGNKDLICAESGVAGSTAEVCKLAYADGSETWCVDLGHTFVVGTGLVINNDDDVIILVDEADNETVLQLDSADGSENWTYDTNSSVNDLAMDGNNNVFICSGCRIGGFYNIEKLNSATGEVVWQYYTAEDEHGDYLIPHGHQIEISDGGYIYLGTSVLEEEF